MLGKLQKTKRSQEGFTIIEVLIVLAIAGLILLIVFLAVPALQRNARNTQRKNDVAELLAAVNNYIDNNNGTQPPTGMGAATIAGNVVTIGTAPATTTLTASYYTAAPTIVSFANKEGYGFANIKENHNFVHNGISNSFRLTAAAPPPATIGPDSWEVVEGATCTATNTVIAGTTRQFVVEYELETANSTATGGGSNECTSS